MRGTGEPDPEWIVTKDYESEPSVDMILDEEERLRTEKNMNL